MAAAVAFHQASFFWCVRRPFSESFAA